ncbi:hypothetical protein Cgig2_031544 [Carnegiea gigantea]|uniref:Uncharacterized protein n=1 Tax=Carnegiea gigantea TaxID=171969 RepID=A0A9Q1QBX8_9CARY|nr:hypothetical protein Cgig2_031544 [Carnegiea gigantea]
MIMFLKSASRRRVNNNEESSSEEERESYCSKEIIGCGSVLTVWKKSLLMSCSGFTVIDGKGNLVFRVDNYCGRPGEIVLMDASGKSMLTVRRQKTIRSLVDTWVIYEGEPNDKKPAKKSTIPSKKQQPIWYVKKQMSILQAPNSKELAQVYPNTSNSSTKKTKSNKNNNNNKGPKYVIQGSYCQRSCQIVDLSSNDVVAEIRRKKAINGCASFGLEVFHLIVRPGFDSGFAMTLVLLLDQMFS